MRLNDAVRLRRNGADAIRAVLNAEVVWQAAQEPSGPVTLATYDFTGANGTMPAGVTSHLGGVSIQGNRLRIAPGVQYQNSDAVLTTAGPVVDSELLATVRFSDVSEAYLVLSARASNVDSGFYSDKGYNVNVQVNGGSSTFRIFRTVNYAATEVATAGAAVAFANLTDYKIRLRCEGDTVSARAWPASGAEPSTWTITYTDPAPVLTAGYSRVQSMPNWTNTSYVEVDDVTISGTAAAPAAPPTEPTGVTTLAWSDDFTGTTVDTAAWNVTDGGTVINNELQHYSPANATVADSNLVITLKSETMNGQAYTSGRITSRDKMMFGPHGTVVGRIKIPSGSGLWPAFWLMGPEDNNAWWPECGEIDIMETVNSMTYYQGTAHGGDGRKPPSYTAGDESHWQAGVGKSINLSDGEFHLFAVKWTTDRLEWFVDNISVGVVTPADMPAGKTWPFNNLPNYILLNMAMGGTMAGTPNGTAPLPAQMLVDWVRVYDTTLTVTPP